MRAPALVAAALLGLVSFVSLLPRAMATAPALVLPGDEGFDLDGLPPLYWRAKELLRHARRRPTLQPSRKWTPPQPATVGVEHVDALVSLTPPDTKLTVELTLRLKGTTNGSTTLELLLEQSLAPSCRDENGKALVCSYLPQSNVLRIELDRTLTPDDPRTLQVSGEGTLSCGDSQVFCALDKELSYLLGGSYLPLPLEPKWRFPGTLRVDVPASYTVAATGFLESVEERPGGRKRWVFAHNEPTMLYSFAVAPYDVKRLQPPSGIDVGVFSLGTGTPNAPAILEHLSKALEFYSAQFAPYPFPKLDAVAIGDKFGGGFGPLATLFISRTAFAIFLDEDHGPAMHHLFAHETGHQWWGHQRDQYGFDDWIVTEAMAEFAAVLFAFDQLDESHFVENLQGYLVGLPRSKDRSLYPYENKGLSSGEHFLLLYARGSLTWLQLRALIGPPLFDKALSSLFDEQRFEYLSVPQIREALVAAAGPLAGTYFDRFVTAKGFPELTLRVRRPRQDAEPISIEIIQGPVALEIPLGLQLASDDGTRVEELIVPVGPQAARFELPPMTGFRGVRVLEGPIFLKTFKSSLAGDIDLNGEVDGSDLIELALHYRRALVRISGNHRVVTPDRDWLWTADLNGDGTIDEADLATLEAAYGQRND